MSLFIEISNNSIPDLQSIIIDYCVKDWKPNFNRVILEIESEVLDMIPDYYTGIVCIVAVYMIHPHHLVIVKNTNPLNHVKLRHRNVLIYICIV